MDANEPERAKWSRGSEDLSGEWSLDGCEKIEFDGQEYPSLGRNAVMSLIGKGGMGYVYFGVNPRLQNEVAIKVLPRQMLEQSEDLQARFMREAQFAARLNSEHLVRVHDVDQDAGSGCYFIVMEYVRGVSAARWRDEVGGEHKTGVSEDRALEVVIAATKGLAAAHSQGIVHRDVKPGNILIPFDDEGKPVRRRAKLSDLGLARGTASEQKNLTAAQATMGTPGYMSPEQAMSAKDSRKPADVFSMGATLYSLLTGRRPFEGSGPGETLVRTAEGDYIPVRQLKPEVSKATAAVIDRCLKVNPDDRYPDASTLLAALEECSGSPAAIAARAPDDRTQPISALGPDIGDTTTLREEDLGLLAPSLQPLPDEAPLDDEPPEDDDVFEAPQFEGDVPPPPAPYPQSPPPPLPDPVPPEPVPPEPASEPPRPEPAPESPEPEPSAPPSGAADAEPEAEEAEEAEWEVPPPDARPELPSPFPEDARGDDAPETGGQPAAPGNDDETMMPEGDALAAALAAAKSSIAPSDYGAAAPATPSPPPRPPPEDQLGDDDETMMPAQDAVAAALEAAKASIAPTFDAPSEPRPAAPAAAAPAPPPASESPATRRREPEDPMSKTSDQVASVLDKIGVTENAAPPEDESAAGKTPKWPFVILILLLLGIAAAAYVFFYMP